MMHDCQHNDLIPSTTGHSGFVSLLNPLGKFSYSPCCQSAEIGRTHEHEGNERSSQQVIWLLMLDRQAYVPSWGFAQCTLLLQIFLGIARRTWDLG